MATNLMEDPIGMIKQIARRDRGAFERFYDRYASLVFTFAVRLLQNRPDAEDLVQDVFLQV
jgi:RNA polymerase sigma-70 factor (ECF subfamily)